MAGPSKAGAKKSAVAEITEAFRSSQATVLTEYRGLKVSELTELRRTLGNDVSYSIVKNTLAKIAAREAGFDSLESLLEGPTAVAFVNGDPVLAAKGLRDFAKAHPFLVLKGGVLDGRALTGDEIRKLADLESREVLLAKLAGAMKGSLSQAVALFAAPLSKVVRTIAALEAVKAAEAASAPVAAEAPAEAVSDAAGEPVAEAVAEAPAHEAAAEEAAPEEAPAESVAEAPAETVAEAPAEPVAEAPAESVAEASAETVAEAPAEPVAEASTEEPETTSSPKDVAPEA